MQRFKIGLLWLSVALAQLADSSYLTNKNFECGPYGFVCSGGGRLRLCEGANLFGPAFLCPPQTVCNEDSSDVCESSHNYIEPALRGAVRCRRNERVADPSVPDCRGYILCIPNKSRFQGIKFKCGGNTIFNGFTRTCSAPDKYRCPLATATTTTRAVELFGADRRSDAGSQASAPHPPPPHKPRPIDCKHYKLSVRQDGPARAAFFCPARPARGEPTVRCTVFSNYFCITLDRDDEDQFALGSRSAYQSPRIAL